MKTPANDLINLQINLMKVGLQFALLPLQTMQRMTEELAKTAANQHGRFHDVCSQAADIADHYGKRAHDIDVEHDL